MKLAFLCVAGGVFVLLLLAWCMTQIHFRIGSRHLKVLLFGIPIRRIALSDITYVSKREPKGIAERWYSTFKTSHRLLTIERKRGIFRRFCITPHNRYVFLADLKSAVRRVDPQAEWAALRASEETSTIQRDEKLLDNREPSPEPEPEGEPSPSSADPG